MRQKTQPKICPPRNFRPAVAPRCCGFTEPPSFTKKTPRSRGARAEGIRYERKVQSALCRRYGDRYLPGPWLSFEENGYRTCQPDGLLFFPETGDIYLIEIKLRHCIEAWFQMRKLYLPVLREMFPAHLWNIKCVEICRWYDPDTVWPEKPLLRENILDTPTGRIGVHILNRSLS